MDFYNTKYKDRQPEETIKIIKDFFINLGFDLNIEPTAYSEIDTWSHYIYLSIDDIWFLGACGKGVTETLSLASGLAELYERFCNKMPIINNIHLMNNSMALSKEKYGYYLHPDEKIMSIEETLKDSMVTQHFSSVIKNPKNREKYLNIICNKQPVGRKYKGFNVEQDKYWDPRIIAKIISSTGMAAGNTIEEALNQGLSEIFERYVSEQIYTNPQEIYYQLDINSITNLALKEKIEKIKEKKYYDLQVFDLSYNYNVPVVMSVLLDKKNSVIIFSIGSFPVFDIALERTLTELYQGINKWFLLGADRFQQPLEQKNWAYTQTHLGSSYIGCYHFPEKILLSNKIVKTPNEVFIDNNNDNKQINDYYRNLADKLNINFYYCDNSFIPEMKAIHIFADNFLPVNGRQAKCDEFTYFEQERMFEYFENYYKLSLIMSKLKTPNDILNFINQILILDNSVKDLYWQNVYNCALNQFDYFIPYGQQDNSENTLLLIKMIYDKTGIDKISKEAKESFYYPTIKKYLALIPYMNYHLDTQEEVKDFLMILNDSYVEEDFINYDNSIYQIHKAIIEPFQKEFSTNRFKTFINSLVYKS